MSSLWHQRYGHLNLRYLSFLTTKQLGDGILDILDQQDIMCEACLAGKQHRMPFDEG
jgi:hypothetical protein